MGQQAHATIERPATLAEQVEALVFGGDGPEEARALCDAVRCDPLKLAEMVEAVTGRDVWDIFVAYCAQVRAGRDQGASVEKTSKSVSRPTLYPVRSYMQRKQAPAPRQRLNLDVVARSRRAGALLVIGGKHLLDWTIGQCGNGAARAEREHRVLARLYDTYRHLPNHNATLRKCGATAASLTEIICAVV